MRAAAASPAAIASITAAPGATDRPSRSAIHSPGAIALLIWSTSGSG